MDYIREYKSFINSHNLNGAIRIVVGITLPAIVLGYFNNLAAGIAVSIGAMCVANTDNPGPIHHRRNGMFACVIIIFIAALLTGLVSVSPTMTGVLVLVLGFAFSMMSIYGNRASSIGVNGLLVLVLNIDRPHHGWEVLINALYILAGGTWYTVLSLLLYSFRPYKLIQQALGDCVQATAGYLRIKASFYGRHADFDRSYRQLVEHQIDLHEKQELLRELLFKSRDIVKETTHTGRVLVMIFLDIVDLFEMVMTSQQDYSMLHKFFDETGMLEEFQRLILDMAVELDEIGIAVKSGKASVETPDLANRIRLLRESFYHFRDAHRNASNVEGFIGLRQILESIEDIGDRLHTLHGYTTYDRKLSKLLQPELDYEQFITHQDINKEMLVENLSIKSNVFRHSLRVSIAAIAGYIISRFLPVGHGYWVLLTIIVILKPAYTLTKRRNFERLAGTIFGALAGLLILYFVNDRHVLFVLMILFMIGTYVFIRTNYLICVTLMTPYVLLLFHLLYPTDFRTIFYDRVIDTGIGSAISFLANIFLLPSRERGQIIEYMLSILRANVAYFNDVGCSFTGEPVSVAAYKLSRKNAFVALANLSDAFGRILAEPKNKREHADRMHQFVVSNHMLTSHIATLSYYKLPGSGGAAADGGAVAGAAGDGGGLAGDGGAAGEGGKAGGLAGVRRAVGPAAAYGDPALYKPVIGEVRERLERTIACLEGVAQGPTAKGVQRTAAEGVQVVGKSEGLSATGVQGLAAAGGMHGMGKVEGLSATGVQGLTAAGGLQDVKKGEDGLIVKRGQAVGKGEGLKEGLLAETAAKQDLRMLNDKMNALIDQRKAELAEGIVDSETRKILSEFKPVIDQFNFISKVTINIDRLGTELRDVGKDTRK